MAPPSELYLSIPTRHGGWVHVPAGSARLRFGGSGLYPASRRAARVHRALLRAWLVLGGAGVVRPRGHLAQGEAWALGDLLRADLPALASAAIFVHPGSRGAITLRLMDRSGCALAYAKYAEAPAERERLTREARMLQAIPRGVGPSLIRFGEFAEGHLMVETPLPGSPCAPRLELDTSQVRLLGSLVRAGPSFPAGDHPFIRSLYEQVPHHRRQLDAVVGQLSGRDWPIAITHGDFTFRNLHRWRGTCLALDWEYGVEAGFPYFDAALWVLGYLKFIAPRPPAEVVPVVTAVLGRCLPGPERPFARPIATLAALYKLGSAAVPSPDEAVSRPDDRRTTSS